MHANLYDLIIIGGGICGFSAAMYAGRLGLKTLVLEGKIPGGTIITTDIVENWPGIKRISGEDLALQVIEHAKEYEIETRDGWVSKVRLGGEEGCFTVITEDDSFEGRTIIFATGAEHRKHPAKGAKKLENRGIHYCALCDGPLYTGREIAVIGGGDSAAKEAILLSKYASRVHLLVKGEMLRAEPVNSKRVYDNKKISVHTGVSVAQARGERKLESLVLETKSGEVEELTVDAAFVAIGIIPRSEVAVSLGVTVNRRKEIVIDRASQTNIPGVFACGDVTDTRFKQAITGAGEAVTAAYWAYTHVTSGDFVCPHGEEKP
ncbi:MAG TPA: thioredoxin-disulfide reductase [Euryarchaeota archaeon]|nr:thioredoxin-disulfide reductase [Euryarchaeota archaeon]